MFCPFERVALHDEHFNVAIVVASSSRIRPALTDPSAAKMAASQRSTPASLARHAPLSPHVRLGLFASFLPYIGVLHWQLCRSGARAIGRVSAITASADAHSPCDLPVTLPVGALVGDRGVVHRQQAHLMRESNGQVTRRVRVGGGGYGGHSAPIAGAPLRQKLTVEHPDVW